MKSAEPRPIKDYCLGIYDGPHATPKEADDGPVFLGIKNLTDDGALDFAEIRHVSEEEYSRWTRRVVPQAGDVVFTYEATLHRYAIIPEGFRGCLGRRVALVRPNPERADYRYLLYFFLSNAWRRVVESNVITGATVDRIPLERFPDFPAALPDLRRQQRIADILSSYDDLIENNRRRMALLEEAARQLYREWFVRLRFPGHEHTRITNGVPEGWERRRVGDLAELKGGKQLESESIAEEGPVPVFGGNGVQGYTTEKTHEGFVIAFGRVGANCGSVHWSYDGAWINNNASGVVPNEYPELFLHHLLNFDFTNLRKGAAQPFIPNGVLVTVEFWSPPRTIAELFCEAVRPPRLQQATLARANQKLRATRDLLLPRLMSGEIAV